MRLDKQINNVPGSPGSPKIAVAWISFEMYRDMLLGLAQKNVKICIYCADHPSNRAQMSTIDDLKRAGIKIELYQMPKLYNFMHHKFAIIDDKVVINGSFNWSKNAAKSFENLMIVEDDLEVVREFSNEFSKLAALDKKAIKSLQSLKKCTAKKCAGKLINILVFGTNPMRMTYEIWGDLIQICSECDYDNFAVLKSAIQDTVLHSHLSSYEVLDDNHEDVDRQRYVFDREFDEYLTGYTIDGNIIHAIGFVVGELQYPDDWVITTRIFWKNKFVEEYVLDEYESNFGVNYD